MVQSVQGLIPPQDLQAGEGLKDGGTIAVLLYPQTSKSGLTALAGGGATNATQLGIGKSEIDTVATAADSVLLPLALAGASVEVFNATATSLTAWPQQANPANAASAADTIVNLAGATVASLAVAGNAVTTFRCFKAGTWKSTT